MRSDVVIVGYRLNAKEPAAKALERILLLTPEAARTLARTFPAVVAHAKAHDEAEQLAAALRSAGAQVELRPATEEPARAHEPLVLPLPPAGPQRAMPDPQGSFELAFPPAPARREAAPREEHSAAYRLGDFGLERGHAASATAIPLVAARAPGEDLSLELELATSPALDLDVHAARELGADRNAPANDLHALAERFEDLAPPAHVPDVEERAWKTIQQRARVEPRRSLAPSTPQRSKGALARAARAWLPSLALLSGLVAGTLLAVGYALDPDDWLTGLRRELSSSTSSAQHETTASEPASTLHPLLARAPASVRPALAALLRARIAGIHQVPVSFVQRGASVDCVLAELAIERETRTRALDETGRRIAPPAHVLAQLREHARALEAVAGHPLELTPVCLAPLDSR